MTSIDVGTDVDWEQLMSSYQYFRDEVLGGDVDGTLLLKAMLTVIHETRGGEDESSIRKFSESRDAVVYEYNRYLDEVDDDLEDVNIYYRDVLHDYISDEYMTEEEEKDILPILMKVVEDNYNYNRPEFRSSYMSSTISNRILNKALELYESEKQMVSILGKDVGGIATQYLR
jgi:hypothetical protein